MEEAKRDLEEAAEQARGQYEKMTALAAKYQTVIGECEASLELLRHLAVSAFMSRHVPIWKEWRRVTGLGFKITVMGTEPEDEEEDEEEEEVDGT
jgi:hypothetical protein